MRFAGLEFDLGRLDRIDDAVRGEQIKVTPDLAIEVGDCSEFLPLLNSKTCDLLDHARLRTQLIGLERRVARSGKDSIDHGPGAHDDIANAVAGVLTSMGVRKYRYDVTMAWAGSMEQSRESKQSVAAQRLGALVQVQTMRGFLR